MAKRFFVRVQLHDVSDGDDAYEDLHSGMEKVGFQRTIVVDDKSAKLPWGTYIGLATKTGGSKEAAGDRVVKAVAATGHTASFVVVETDASLQVSNLEPEKQPKTASETYRELVQQVMKKRSGR